MRKEREVTQKFLSTYSWRAIPQLGRDFQLSVSVGQAGWGEYLGLGLLIPGVQEKHPWGCALSWCHGLINHLLVSPALPGASFISLQTAFVRLVVLLSGIQWVFFCVQQDQSTLPLCGSIALSIDTYMVQGRNCRSLNETSCLFSNGPLPYSCHSYCFLGTAASPS